MVFLRTRKVLTAVVHTLIKGIRTRTGKGHFYLLIMFKELLVDDFFDLVALPSSVVAPLVEVVVDSILSNDELDVLVILCQLSQSSSYLPYSHGGCGHQRLLVFPFVLIKSLKLTLLQSFWQFNHGFQGLFSLLVEIEFHRRLLLGAFSLWQMSLCDIGIYCVLL